MKKHPIKGRETMHKKALTQVKERSGAVRQSPEKGTGQRTLTGRMLVRLDTKASGAAVIRQAKTKALRLITVEEWKDTLSDALLQYDGIVFDRLKVAVVNEESIGRLRQFEKMRDSLVVSIEPERYIRASQAASKGKGRGSVLKDTAAATWGIQAIGAMNNGATGKGVKLAVLDTGFDFTHPDFTGRTLHRKSFVETRQANDKEGHGSHCAGIAGGGRKNQDGTRYGVAYGARLYIGKILDDGGEGTDGQALAGIEWALEKGVQVISMSFGAPVEEGQVHSAVFEQAAQIAMANQCLLIAATGNESEHSEGDISPVNHPANCPSVMAVGALTQTLEVADYSCAGIGGPGGQVDIAAPGDQILSIKAGGGYRRETGTSMATAFVAGVAALLWQQYPQASAGDIWAKLLQQARRLALPASEVGGGLVSGGEGF